MSIETMDFHALFLEYWAHRDTLTEKWRKATADAEAEYDAAIAAIDGAYENASSALDKACDIQLDAIFTLRDAEWGKMYTENWDAVFSKYHEWMMAVNADRHSKCRELIAEASRESKAASELKKTKMAKAWEEQEIASSITFDAWLESRK
jgi:Skp family chaperone for outer membrane proteins